MEVKHRKLADLTPDRKNANKGTPRGSQMIEDSFRQYGAGRSILIDKNGLIIAGNKSAPGMWTSSSPAGSRLSARRQSSRKVSNYGPSTQAD
jgi:hypothetical protein